MEMGLLQKEKGFQGFSSILLPACHLLCFLCFPLGVLHVKASVPWIFSARTA